MSLPALSSRDWLDSTRLTQSLLTPFSRRPQPTAAMATKRKCDEISPPEMALTCDLTSLVLDFGGAALNVATHLAAKDVLDLQVVDKGWRDLIGVHEDALFDALVRKDFIEGDMLADIVKERSDMPGRHDAPSMKKIYLAFHRRFKLHEQDGNHVCIHWRRPERPPASSRRDGESLVYIARVGDHCAQMDYWNSDLVRHACLALKSFEDFTLSLPRELLFDGTTRSLGSMEYLNFRCNVKQLVPITLHVVDVQRCQIMTLMENALSRKTTLVPTIGEAFLQTNGHVSEDGHTSHGRASLYGMPRYKRLERDWDDDLVDLPDDVEHLCVVGATHLRPSESDGNVFQAKNARGLTFNFLGGFHRNNDVIERRPIYNFFEEVMRQKCR